MKMWFPFCVAVLVIASASVTALGCECPRKRSFEMEMAASDMVFSGEVIGISTSDRSREVAFRPAIVWKGEKTDSIVIQIADLGATCGFNFKQGNQYLVYASHDGKALRTSICTRTKPAEYAYDDINILNDRGWSQPVNGLRARISLVPDYHGDSPFFRVFLEMQHVAKDIGHRNIRFSPSRLDLRVVDQSGGEVPAVEPMYNGFSPDWKEFSISYKGTTKLNISYPGAGYLRPDSMAIDLGPWRIWRLALGGNYFVTAKLVIPSQKDDHPFLDWSGTLEMPMLVIQAVPPRSVQTVK
jgi:hypothetical protein